nr:PREDICTED: uncharacterized protein LOC103564511 [Equus przewalskii]
MGLLHLLPLSFPSMVWTFKHHSSQPCRVKLISVDIILLLPFSNSSEAACFLSYLTPSRKNTGRLVSKFRLAATSFQRRDKQKQVTFPSLSRKGEKTPNLFGDSFGGVPKHILDSARKPEEPEPDSPSSAGAVKAAAPPLCQAAGFEHRPRAPHRLGEGGRPPPFRGRPSPTL